jgi:hypothetical protein
VTFEDFGLAVLIPKARKCPNANSAEKTDDDVESCLYVCHLIYRTIHAIDMFRA